MAAMVPYIQRRRMQQPARIMCDKTVLFKLKDIIPITLYFTF